MNTLNTNQKEHLAAFNKFATMENEQISEFIEKHYKGVGTAYFSELISELDNGTYAELSKNLLLFGNINENDGQRIFFMEELEGMDDEEILSLFKNDFENKHVLITYYYMNRMAGFDVDEIKELFEVSEEYLREKFALYFLSKGI